MNLQDAWLELVAVKKSWYKQGLEPHKAFALLTAMLCKFALANNMSLENLRHDVTELLSALYNELKESGCKVNALPTIHLPDKMVS